MVKDYRFVEQLNVTIQEFKAYISLNIYLQLWKTDNCHFIVKYVFWNILIPDTYFDILETICPVNKQSLTWLNGGKHKLKQLHQLLQVIVH